MTPRVRYFNNAQHQYSQARVGCIVECNECICMFGHCMRYVKKVSLNDCMDKRRKFSSSSQTYSQLAPVWNQNHIMYRAKKQMMKEMVHRLSNRMCLEPFIVVSFVAP